MKGERLNIFAALLIATAFTASYRVTEAEGSSGETWAKALPSTEATPTESECQPYIEKAIKKLTTDGSKEELNDEPDTPIKDCDNSVTKETIETTDNVASVIYVTEDDTENVATVVSEDELNTENESQTTDTSKNTDDEENNTNYATNNDEEKNNNDEKDNNDDKTDNNETVEITQDTISVVQNEDDKSESKVNEEDSDATNKQDDHDSIINKKDDKNSANEDDKIKENDNNDDDNVDDDDSKETVKIKKFIPRRRKRQIEKLIKNSKNIKTNKYEMINNDDDDNVSDGAEEQDDKGTTIQQTETEDKNDGEEENDDSDMPEEELTKNQEIPTKLRSRNHIMEILQLEEDENDDKGKLQKLVDSTLKELKKLYDNAIKPLEVLYKYRDLSNRHFGDAEIFSKPLILFMGPWSGGKSTLINYLLDNEFSDTALRTGAEPSPAYFNILMSGENETVLDGTQLAADGTFSGLQKFGQGLLDRLKGLQIPHPLLEKVNIVEIPGILEIRKQVERMFPFNDACQWFIDRADVIFLVYDPSKLDVGPETEAILDQLKGREYQTRIILNKADQVKAEELMRVQGTLIWNISPLMSSVEPPIMYTTSLWSIPYEKGSPSKLLYSQEISFLKDLRSTIAKRVENKIASARRFAVRVRNHAKMVDCYLTTYYNHKSFFGNRKKVNDDIVERPQNYHIYEGLSTLTNISRYDLPDPDVYKDFFRLHPIYEFQRLSDTCTYFRGCPINKLDIAIAYDLPDLVGKYKRQVESILSNEPDTSKNIKKYP